MIRVNTADFRASMSSYLDKAINGEKVMITRKDQMFMLTPVHSHEIVLTPELEARIKKERAEIAQGKGQRFNTVDEMNEWLEKL